MRVEADNVLKMFLNYMVYTTCISVNQCERDEETYQSVLPAEICYQELLIMTNRDVCNIVNVLQNMPLSILVNLQLLHLLQINKLKSKRS